MISSVAYTSFAEDSQNSMIRLSNAVFKSKLGVVQNREFFGLAFHRGYTWFEEQPNFAGISFKNVNFFDDSTK